MAGQRLSSDDALTLLTVPRTSLAVLAGWRIRVRERMHGDKTYFNVNRHINPTNVAWLPGRLCAFWPKKDTPALTPSGTRRSFQTAASGYSEAVTEFHIVGGLHHRSAISNISST